MDSNKLYAGFCIVLISLFVGFVGFTYMLNTVDDLAQKRILPIEHNWVIPPKKADTQTVYRLYDNQSYTKVA